MSLLFQERHIPMIRDGTKTATRRIWDDDYPRPRVGSVRGAVTDLFTPTEEIDCWIRITDHRQEILQMLSQEDLEKEGDYFLNEFKQLWEDLYGEWDQKQVVDVVEFEYVGRKRPEPELVADGGEDLDEYRKQLRELFVAIDALRERAGEPDVPGIVEQHIEVSQRHVEGAKEAVDRELEDRELATDGGQEPGLVTTFLVVVGPEHDLRLDPSHRGPPLDSTDIRIHGFGWLKDDAFDEVRERVDFDAHAPGTEIATVTLDCAAWDYAIDYHVDVPPRGLRERVKRLVTDGGFDEAVILADERARRLQWHRVRLDPDTGMWSGLPGKYRTVCGRKIDPDNVRDLDTDGWSVVAPRDACPSCHPSRDADRQELVTDGGRESITCYDCERGAPRSAIGFYDVPVPNDDGLGYEMVPVPLCRDCQLRRYGVKCQHCGEYHADAEAVFECQRDNPRLVPDGGIDVEALVDELEDAEPGDLIESLPRRPLTPEEAGLLVADGGTEGAGSDWEYQTGEVLKKDPSGITTPDGEDVVDTGTRYTVKYRLKDDDSEDRFYYFEYRMGKEVKNRLAFAPMVERDWERHLDTDSDGEPLTDGGQPKADDRIVIAADGENLRVEAFVNGERIFHAEPTAKRSELVVHAAIRTWGRRVYPELVEQADAFREENGGAFQ